MAISKSTIEKMAALLGVKADEVSTAFAAEGEVDLTIPTVEIFTSAQISARDNIKYNEGKEAGEEMAVKAAKEAKGLDFKGKKVSSLVEHLETLKTPDESDTLKKLRDNLTKAEQERDTIKGSMAKMKLETTIHSYIPELSNGMSKAEAMAVLSANGFEFHDNGDVFRNGMQIKDEKMLTAIPANEAVSKFFSEEKKWVGAIPATDPIKQGRGAGSSQARPGVSRSIKDVEDAWVAEHGQGSINGSEYAAHLESKMKEAKEAGQELV